LVFIGIKAYEYSHAIRVQLFPGANFAFPGEYAAPAEMFFTLYFTMTALHALHLFIGVLMVTVLSVLSLRGHFTRERYAPIEVIGLYWHFVDIVWIFLFPLLYLVNPG
jgi:cytochrome c oxidase subunit 3